MTDAAASLRPFRVDPGDFPSINFALTTSGNPAPQVTPHNTSTPTKSHNSWEYESISSDEYNRLKAEVEAFRRISQDILVTIAELIKKCDILTKEASNTHVDAE